MLYVAYSEWCKASGEQPLSKKALNPRLRERGYEEGRTNKARGWKGIGLALDDDPVATAIAAHPQGLALLQIICSTGQPCARIYSTRRNRTE